MTRLALLCLVGLLLRPAFLQAESEGPEPPDLSEVVRQAVLPQVQAWEGKSRGLVAPPDDPWITPSEQDDLTTSPDYATTVQWLQKLVAAAPQLQMISFGKSPEGRDLWLIVAAQEKVSTPEELRKNGKPIVIAQAGIHAGEIDGKDAGMMLLRDMTVRGTKRDLLEQANFLFVPIFNVDGHERRSPYSRVNQRGPEVMGWRTTARNLNLNRDYAKADAPEMAALLRLINEWQPDLYLDLHVTDGVDYQYDITFGSNGSGGYSPAIGQWLEKTFGPAVTANLEALGHVPGRVDVPNWIDPLDWRKGIDIWMADPRFSTGYGDVRHLPTVLLETHALKPYDRRVLGTYVFLEGALRAAGKNARELRQAITADRQRRRPTIPLTWENDPKAPAETMEYKAIEMRVLPSAITGGLRVEYTGTPVTEKVPVRRKSHVSTAVSRPKAYWVPAAWTDVIARLQLHGIEMERIDAARELPVTMYRLQEAKLDPEPFEGRVRLTAKPVPEKRTERFAPGSVRISTDQPLGDLAIILCEPASPDSFFQWGFFTEVLQATEYIEPYVIEPMADRMLAAEPKLMDEFREKLARDEAFRASPKERLRWFYDKTPFTDERWKLYPIAREE